MTKIDGGATLWARKTIDSDIFYNKPDVWFKIWFYLVNQVNHKDDKRFKRGTCFLKYEWIMNKTGATKNQVKHCVEFLKKDKMLATQKATRGFIIKVNKYNDYQTLDNYKKPQEKESKRNTEGTQKEHRSHTINKYDNNDKNEKKGDTLSSRCALIIDYLNEKTGRNEKGQRKFDPKNAVVFLRARFNEGRTVKDCIDVIDIKLKDWSNDEKMFQFLRPSTLFKKTNFENYVSQKKPDKYAKYYEKEK